MASITTAKNGSRRIQFYESDGQRRTVHLGEMPLKNAQGIKLHIEELVVAKRSSMPIAPRTAGWVGDLEDGFYAKLVKVELVPAREMREAKRTTLDNFLADYIASRQDVGEGTRANLGHARRRLVEILGEDRNLQDITRADADRCTFKLKADLAEATAARTIKHARQFFAAALRAKFINENPFEGIKPGSMENRDRMHFVTRADTKKLLDVTPNSQWRLLIALARFGGLRTPSEPLALTWGDINWEQGKMLIRSPKTGNRWIPIFPEVRPHLEEAFDRAEPGTVNVITLTRTTRTNLRTHLGRLIFRAGLKPWPRLWQNMRASRATELADQFPGHVAAAWLGHSEAVANVHYRSVTEEHFQAAFGDSAKYDATKALNTTLSGTLPNNAEVKKGAERAGKAEKFEVLDSSGMFSEMQTSYPARIRT